MIANKNKNIRLLKTAKGQVDGIIKMIDDDRPCMEISHQMLAIISVLKKANNDIMYNHLKLTIKNVIDKEEQVDELMAMIDKFLQ